jgi:hypothetical protein
MDGQEIAVVAGLVTVGLCWLGLLTGACVVLFRACPNTLGVGEQRALAARREDARPSGPRRVVSATARTHPEAPCSSLEIVSRRGPGPAPIFTAHGIPSQSTEETSTAVGSHGHRSCVERRCRPLRHPPRCAALSCSLRPLGDCRFRLTAGAGRVPLEVRASGTTRSSTLLVQVRAPAAPGGGRAGRRRRRYRALQRSLQQQLGERAVQSARYARLDVQNLRQGRGDARRPVAPTAPLGVEAR